ncbi:TetR family transcriptional regulator [Pseudonocardia yuanmonensis]|uniref:TetR family transcriptional regulator n=1 Tax=Pseudonocardia yuanmonensis TaxID=1095914 RepID=A0ABP8WZK2_9PSEU
MGRWEPNAKGRLREAALDLYVERGFEQTTVAEIAARAGLTARTFFRHFPDKREVLFAGSTDLERHMVDALVGAPEAASPMTAVGVALDAAAAALGGNRDFARRRHLVITANGELQERELIKMTRLSAALAGGLGRRGVAEADARLAAEAGIAVLRVAFERWVTGPEERDLAEVMRESVDRLRSLTR